MSVHRRSRDHDLGRFHNRNRILASPELERTHRVRCDDGGQALIAYAQLDLREQAIHANFLDVPE
jgi:hypothetical protein